MRLRKTKEGRGQEQYAPKKGPVGFYMRLFGALRKHVSLRRIAHTAFFLSGEGKHSAHRPTTGKAFFCMRLL